MSFSLILTVYTDATYALIFLNCYKWLSMKNILKIFLPFCLIFILAFSGCRKKNASGSQISQLPPLTTRGLNTFGCLVNGKALVPEEPIGDIGPYYACTYQYLYADTSKPYDFAVWGKDKPSACIFSDVAIGLDSVNIKTGDVYDLTAWADSTGHFVDGRKHASYIVTSSCLDMKTYYTTNAVRGQITIVLLDPVNQIASGTFWFDAIFAPGDTVHVTEGRFDMHYTD